MVITKEEELRELELLDYYDKRLEKDVRNMLKKEKQELSLIKILSKLLGKIEEKFGEAEKEGISPKLTDEEVRASWDETKGLFTKAETYLEFLSRISQSEILSDFDRCFKKLRVELPKLRKKGIKIKSELELWKKTTV